MMNINRNYLISIAVFLILIAWLFSGYFFNTPKESSEPRDFEATPLMRVQVIIAKNQLVQNEIILSGKTAPGRLTNLRAEIPGKIIQRYKNKGETVETAEKIIEIDLRDWQQQLVKAKALARQFELEYSGARKLEKKGLVSQTHLAEIYANLQTAKAEIKRIEVKINASTIKAPFSGVLDDIPVELGDFVKEGDSIATVLDFSPYVIEGDISENQAANLHEGMLANAQLITNEIVSGKIRYIQSVTNEATRTVSIELEIPNQDKQITAGMTAEIKIPLPKISAIFISPALLGLNEAGDLGVNIVDKTNHVKFLPVKLVRAEANGAWASGVDDGTRIIAVGGGFIEIGDKVIPIQE